MVNGLFCNGEGICQIEIDVDCSGAGDQCNHGVCDETSDRCERAVAQTFLLPFM